MKNTTVRVYDVNTEKCSEIPAAELAPGMLKATIEGWEDLGEVYIQADTLKGSGVRNQLPEGFEPIALAVLELLKPRLYWIKTEDDWLDGFRADAHPVHELMMWMWLGAVYHSMTHDGSDTEEVAQDVFNVLLSSMNDKSNPLETVALSHISKARARAIVESHNRDDRVLRMSEFWAPRIDSEALIRLMKAEGRPQ